MSTATMTKMKPAAAKTTKQINPMRVSKTKKPEKTSSSLPTDPTLAPILSEINNASSITPFERRVYAALMQVPRGHFTTYGALAAHLSSSPRAIGNAMRRNPFAPRVPCHRVVATGGSLGGFKGKRPPEGRGGTLDEKQSLLRGEGVRFDGEGLKVLGSPFVAFV